MFCKQSVLSPKCFCKFSPMPEKRLYSVFINIIVALFYMLGTSILDLP